MKMTVKVIVLLVMIAFSLFPLINMYWEYAWRIMLYFTFITNVAMWSITLKVYVFQQELKNNMDTPFLKRLFGRGKKNV